MVNNDARISWLIACYVALALGTVVALLVLTAAAPTLATDEAWGHAVLVALFAVLLPLRWRAARRGSRRARRAVAVVAVVLLVVNLVEAALPGVFPGWMRVEMLVTAALMAATAALLARRRETSILAG